MTTKEAPVILTPEETECIELLYSSIFEVNKVKAIRRERGDVIVNVKDNTDQMPRYSIVLNERQEQAMKGAGFGEYLRARHLGVQDIANEVLLEAGIPQAITFKQEKFLEDWDKKYDK